MFSGIVECTGKVIAIDPRAGGLRLCIDLAAAGKDVKPGDSIAVDGVCLTAVDPHKTHCSFDVITETLSKTSLEQCAVGSKVNLERSLRVGDRIDGHYVQGHVHGVGRVVDRILTDQEFKLWVAPPDQLKSYIIPLGSVAVNGVSMTVSDLRPDAFAMALIPTTLERTNLGQLDVDNPINIETDILARQIVHWLEGLALNETLRDYEQRLATLESKCGGLP